MKMQPGNKLLITTAAMAALAAICLLALATALSHAEPVPGGEQVQQRAVKLPRLFDFGYFKEKFGKRYESLVDELVHKTYFVARTFRAYVSGMKYKFRTSSYFLAVNHMSDASPQELEMRENKLLADDHASQAHGALKIPASSLLSEFLPHKGEKYEEKVLKLIEAHRNEPGYHELLEESTRGTGPNNASVEEKEAPRDLSLDDLIKPGVNETIQEPADVQQKITSDVESNNPHHEQPKLQTSGLNYGHKELALYGFPPAPRDPAPIDQQLDSSLSTLKNAEVENGAHKEKLKDVMYYDHRNSNCLMQPRDQGTCASCYAFASMALMEWLYCMKKGKLVPFSEQYIVDCGNGRYDKLLSGCDGAKTQGIFKFISNFGIERAKDYPYHGTVQQCPYHEDTDIRAAGYLKMDLGNVTEVPVYLWELFIAKAPLYVVIAWPLDYPEYSGGVHDGMNCREKGNHAQLLVGHGREDGKDYWLFRNSFGTNWGEGGYFKLSKNAPLRCIEEQRGFALGTSDALNYKNPEKNEENKMLRWLRKGFSI